MHITLMQGVVSKELHISVANPRRMSRPYECCAQPVRRELDSLAGYIFPRAEDAWHPHVFNMPAATSRARENWVNLNELRPHSTFFHFAMNSLGVI